MNRATKAERIAGHTVHYISDNDIFEVYGCPGKITGGAILRLSAYEETGLEPEEIERILDSYGRGMTLRTENAQRLEIIKEIPINRLRELAQAKKEGRPVVPPCDVGDVVWTNFSMSGWYFREKDRPYSAKVVFIGLNDSDDMAGGFINVSYEKNNGMMQFSFSDIGKTVFLTREAAEAALEEMGVQ